MITGSFSTGTSSNYGSTFTKGGQVIGLCQVIEWPEISTDPIEQTNHSSAGVREFIPSGLIGLGEVTLSVILQSGKLVSMVNEMGAKTISACVIANALYTGTFQGFYTSIKTESADAQSPDVVKATVVLQPASGISLT